MRSHIKNEIDSLFRLEGTTGFFGRQVPAHRNLGCLYSFAGAVLFWVCFAPSWFTLVDLLGFRWQDASLILFCSIEAFLRGIWITLLLKRYALFYVLLSILVVPLTSPLWVWIYGFGNVLFVVYGLVIVLSALAGVALVRLFQVRKRKLAT